MKQEQYQKILREALELHDYRKSQAFWEKWLPRILWWIIVVLAFAYGNFMGKWDIP
jgi:hypothetical protein